MAELDRQILRELGIKPIPMRELLVLHCSESTRKPRS